MQQPEFDQYSQNYSEDIDKVIGVFGQKHDFFIQAKADLLIPIFNRLASGKSGAKVLDIGCGVGLLHPYLVKSVGNLAGADVSGSSIEIARRNNPGVDYSVYDGTALPYPDGAFDCALAVTVMHHVPPEQWPAFMREAKRVVRPGGQVIVIEHNPLNPATVWAVKRAPMDENAVLLSASKVRELMRAEGMQTQTRYFLLTPFGGGLFRKMDEMLAAVPLGAQYMTAGSL
jgi:ubiquinone/menaquinone biosynthesis C-methylase UbiE